MTKRLTQHAWKEWERTVVAKTTTLLRTNAIRDAPVPLAPLLDAVKARVVFRPLLVNGATAPRHDGFTIYCRCESADAPAYELKLSDASDMGRSLPARARFTLAHELVHTFFFDQRVQPPKNRLEPNSDATLNKLERLCDRG